MEQVKAEVSKTAKFVSEIAITDENMKKEFAKRKNWTAPAIDGIQNFWWKNIEPGQKALRKAFTDLYMDTAMIPEWRPSGRAVLLSKTKKSQQRKELPFKYMPQYIRKDLDEPGD